MELKTIIVKTLAFIVSVLNEQEANPDYYLVTGDGKKIVFESKEAMDLYYEMNSPLKNRSEIPSGEVDNDRNADMRKVQEYYREYLKNRRRQIDNHGQ